MSTTRIKRTKVIRSFRMRNAPPRMASARTTLGMAISGPRSNRSANAPAGSASRSHGRLSAATTLETASGRGSTTTASSGTAPVAKPSPELASVKPIQSRVNGRPSRFLRIRCFARLRMLMAPAAVSRHADCQALASVPACPPFSGATAAGAASASNKIFAKGGIPPCRKEQGNAPYQRRDGAITCC